MRRTTQLDRTVRATLPHSTNQAICCFHRLEQLRHRYARNPNLFQIDVAHLTIFNKRKHIVLQLSAQVDTFRLAKQLSKPQRITFMLFYLLESTFSPASLLAFRSRYAFALNGTMYSVPRTETPPTVRIP